MLEPRQTQTVAIDDEPIIDVQGATNLFGYIFRATKRRRPLVIRTFALVVVLVAIATALMPRSYRIETRILTRKTQVMRTLVDPGSSIPPSADAPTSGAIELIKSRENLENLITDVKLEELFNQQRSSFARFKDNFFEKIFGKANAVDQHEAYVKLLDDRLKAVLEGDVLVMSVEWTNPQIALQLAEGAVNRFLKMRRDMELSEIQETVKILSRNVQSSRSNIEEHVAMMQKLFQEKETEFAIRSGQVTREQAAHRKPSRKHFIAIRRPLGPEQAAAGLGDLKKAIDGKHAEVLKERDKQQARARRAEEELQNLKGVLGADHPDVLNAQREIEKLSRPSEELLALQKEEADLTERAAKPAASPAVAAEEDAVDIRSRAGQDDSNFEMMRVPVSEELFKQLDKDPELATILSELKKDQDAHQELVLRLARARIEIETANVAFEFRYVMTAPPVMPKQAVKPNVPVMLGGGAVGALLLGIFLAAVADLLSGRILEPWQIESSLKVKLLGEIEAP